jgi:hypothetical protein
LARLKGGFGVGDELSKSSGIGSGTRSDGCGPHGDGGEEDGSDLHVGAWRKYLEMI